MLNPLRWLYLLGIIILLSGCGPVYKTTYSLIPPVTADGKQCVKQCQQSKRLCQNLCNSEHGSCIARTKREARAQYKHYQQEQQRQGKPVENTFADFYNPAGCTKRACGCKEDYRACFQMCGGELVPHRQCISNCDKAKAEVNR